MVEGKVIQEHRRGGRWFAANGVRSFVLESGDGPHVLCIHGMWGSSFLYRRVIREIASRGLHGAAFDLPGFGLAERPANYDYSWTGLGRFCIAAVEQLGLERFHLVVHDIGGPVGFELATALRERVASLTLLNTVIDVTEFHSPITMEPFRHRVIGELWLGGLLKPIARTLLRRQGIGNQSAVSDEELDAYVDLMKGDDGGRAFLKVMRSSERTTDKQDLYRSAVQHVPYPVQIIWSKEDPTMTLQVYGRRAESLIGSSNMHIVHGKHFLQEDQAPAIARQIAKLVTSVTSRNMVPAAGQDVVST